MSGELDQIESDALMRASQEIQSRPLFIDDVASRSVPEIRSISRKLHRKHDLQLIVIDYLQLVQPDDTRVPREQQVATITRQLKTLAKELAVPILALSQLNRGVELREDKRPRLSDLRESGAIEQDADLVIFLHRPAAYDPEDRPGEADVIIAKHRNGPTGTATLAWLDKTMRFGDLSCVPDSDSF